MRRITVNEDRVTRIHYLKNNFFCIDGISLNDLDFIDIEKFIDSPGVLQIINKSLIFTRTRAV